MKTYNRILYKMLIHLSRLTCVEISANIPKHHCKCIDRLAKKLPFSIINQSKQLGIGTHADTRTCIPIVCSGACCCTFASFSFGVYARTIWWHNAMRVRAYVYLAIECLRVSSCHSKRTQPIRFQCLSCVIGNEIICLWHQANIFHQQVPLICVFYLASYWILQTKW